MLQITKDSFDREVLQAQGKVVVDFSATWCMPCRMLAPVLEEIAAEHSEIKFVKVAVDQEGELSAQMGVVSIPLLVVFRGGEQISSMGGFHSKQEVLRFLGL